MSMDAPLRSRLLLSLRSEAALGLRSVQACIADSCGQTEASIEEPAAAAAIDARDRKPDTSLSGAPVAGALFAEAALPSHAAAAAGPMRLSEPITLPLLATEQKNAALAEMNAKEVSVCVKCRLHSTRTQTVFGEGDVDAKIFFIGEGPGETEDQTGRPFVGRAGQLLDKMIGAMGLSRRQVFIANIVKCRPPGNRVPAPDEVATCTPYLVRQLEIIRPRVIVTLGLPAVKYMLDDPKLTMGRVRGQWKLWRGIKLMPTYHPSFVLRSYTEANRQAVWSDLQQVMKEVGLASKRTAARS